MADLYRIWSVAHPLPVMTRDLAAKLGVMPAFAQVLVNRGLDNIGTAHKFLYGCFDDLLDPFEIKDMDRAVTRILFAIDNKQQITVYGDYDVDGITACSLLLSVLAELGASADFYIPDRQNEGYGLNLGAVQAIVENGSRLILTVDCGISAVNEVEAFKDKIDIIITDHHEPPEHLPDAYALINPHQKECHYQDKNLAGVGVAFKLCQALLLHTKRPLEELKKYLDIVAVGTIADIVPLVGENRILVREGLKILQQTKNIGLGALLEVCKLTGSKIDAGKVGYVLAPRLNAAGRISRASAGVELLTTRDAEQAGKLAMLLDEENRERQMIEKDIVAEAMSIIESKYKEDKVFVIDGHEWHTGVIGIVASRIVEKYFRPTIVISLNGDVGKGSCRSIPGFDMYKGLTKCSELLLQFGGHRQAAGLTIRAQDVGLLREKMNHIAQAELGEKDYIPIVNIDSMIALEEINNGFIEQLSCLAPYGMGNPSPIFACEDLAVTASYVMGKDSKHLKLKVRSSGAAGEIVAWNMAEMAGVIDCGTNIDLAFVPEINEWMGQKKIQLRAQDVKLSAKEKSYKDNKLVDARLINKECYLRQTLYRFEKTIIFVNDVKSRDLLYNNILVTMPSTINCKVALYTDQVDWGDVSSIIFYDVPHGWRFFKNILSEFIHLSGVTAFFLYNKDGIKHAQELSTEFVLNRDFIARIYLLLKRQTTDSTLDRLITRYEEHFSSAVSASRCRRAISVLEQIGLVNMVIENGETTFVLAPMPGVKLSLETSRLYRDMQHEKHELEEYIIKPTYYASDDFICYIGEVLTKLSEGRL